jgi:hypothetical protein
LEREPDHPPIGEYDGIIELAARDLQPAGVRIAHGNDAFVLGRRDRMAAWWRIRHGVCAAHPRAGERGLPG